MSQHPTRTGRPRGTLEALRLRHLEWQRQYLDDGRSLRAIGAEAGVSDVAVRKALDRLGTERRPPGRPPGQGAIR